MENIPKTMVNAIRKNLQYSADRVNIICSHLTVDQIFRNRGIFFIHKASNLMVSEVETNS